MIRFFTTLFVALNLAVAVYAGAPENTLMIEVAGESNGEIEIELLPDVAPKHVERIKKLVREGSYNGVVFHRVINGFMAQTGDVQFGNRDGLDLGRAGMGGSKYDNLPAEFSDINYDKGIVGMARSGHPDSANSQFFIMFNEVSQLNNQYTVVGRVIAGQDVVDAIKKGKSNANGAVNDDPDYMKKLWIKGDQ